jgi:hypothetical protein
MIVYIFKKTTIINVVGIHRRKDKNGLKQPGNVVPVVVLNDNTDALFTMLTRRMELI